MDVDLISLVPDKHRWIISHDLLEDGDTYACDEGLTLEFEEEQNRFLVKKRGVTLGYIKRYARG